MTSSNHYINIQLAKFISSCFDLRNIQLSNQTNALDCYITLLYDHDNRYHFSFSFSLQKLLQHCMYLYGHANKAACCCCGISCAIYKQ